MSQLETSITFPNNPIISERKTTPCNNVIIQHLAMYTILLILQQEKKH